MTQSNAVWYSCMQTDEAYNKTYRFGFSFPNLYNHHRWYELEYKHPRTAEEQQEWHQLNRIAINIQQAYLAHKKLPVEQPPTILYTHHVTASIHKEFKGLFEISDGYQILTQPCYELLQQFNLAQGTQFFPIHLHDQNTNEPLNNETYYLMNLTESSWRNYFIFESCEAEFWDYKESKGGVSLYHLIGGEEFDNAISLSAEALNCDLDLWHDPALHGSMFMSDRLKQALAQAGFLEHWYVLSTQLIYKH